MPALRVLHRERCRTLGSSHLNKLARPISSEPVLLFWCDGFLRGAMADKSRNDEANPAHGDGVRREAAWVQNNEHHVRNEKEDPDDSDR